MKCHSESRSTKGNRPEDAGTPAHYSDPRAKRAFRGGGEGGGGAGPEKEERGGLGFGHSLWAKSSMVSSHFTKDVGSLALRWTVSVAVVGDSSTMTAQ